MRDPDERSASLALRNGGPASLRRAIGWYRTHDRLRCGDAITMAADVLGSTAPTPPLARMRCWCVTPPRWPTLLTSVYTTTPSAPRRQPSAGARAPHCRRRPHHQPPKRHVHPLRNANDTCGLADPVRNGNRWRVTAIDAEAIASPPDASTTAPSPSWTANTCASTSPRLRRHRALRPRRHRRTTHAVLGENTSRKARRGNDPRPRNQHRLHLRTGHRTGVWPVCTARMSWTAETAITRVACCVPSSPTTTSR